MELVCSGCGNKEASRIKLRLVGIDKDGKEVKAEHADDFKSVEVCDKCEGKR